MKTRREKRIKRKLRVRAKIQGTGKRPRLSVFRSHHNVSAQIIDDDKEVTIVSVKVEGKTRDAGKKLGQAIAALAKEKHITKVLFDRSGYRYHGVIKAIADAVREGGLTI